MKDENIRRNKELDAPYNPYLGIGSPIERFKFCIKEGVFVNIPITMLESKLISDIIGVGSLRKFVEKTQKEIVDHDYNEHSFDLMLELFNMERNKHDFEFWAATTIKIKHKETGMLSPFILNRPQREILVELEDMRTKNIPIRAILLKARQFGGSTLIEFYSSWIQLIHKQNWNSAIIGDIDDQARNIRGMYTTAAEYYPKEMGAMTLKPFENSANNKQIIETGAVIYIGSMQHPEAIRSSDIKIGHFSEVASWKETKGKKPTDLLQSIKASIPNIPYTMIVEESTAKGVGNYFHKSWLAAESSKKGYMAIFIPWYHIERYRIPFSNEKEIDTFIKNMNDYDTFLWNEGATLESIKWYKYFLETEFKGDTVLMMSEFPTTSKEAFQSTGHRVIPRMATQKAALNCTKPLFRGNLTSDGEYGKDVLTNISFDEYFAAKLWLWAKPDKSVKMRYRYVVSLDIGGTTSKADWSVMRVFDRYWMIDGGVPEAIATFRLHVDQDRLAWMAVRLAEYFNHALLVVESNSLRTQKNTEGDGFLTILDEIKDTYDNIYTRKSEQDKVVEGAPVKYGFHTNKATKSLIIFNLRAAMRDGGYVERDQRMIDEAEVFEHKPDGTMGAVDGEHDDILMSTAIGLYVCLKEMPMPVIVDSVKSKKKRRGGIKSEASF